ADDAYQQLLIIEDELAYDYLQGRLSSAQKLHFESTVALTERGGANLEFARLLLSALQSPQVAARTSRHWIPAAAAAALLLAAIPAWLAMRLSVLNGELEKLRAENAAASSRFERQLSAAQAAALAPPVEAAFLLTPGLARGGSTPARLELVPQ